MKIYVRLLLPCTRSSQTKPHSEYEVLFCGSSAQDDNVNSLFAQENAREVARISRPSFFFLLMKIPPQQKDNGVFWITERTYEYWVSSYIKCIPPRRQEMMGWNTNVNNRKYKYILPRFLNQGSYLRSSPRSRKSYTKVERNNIKSFI